MNNSSPQDYFSNLSYLMIETNSSCNLKCVFCNREDLKEMGYREPNNITIKQYEKHLKIFEPCSIDTIKVEGISEPMLHPKFDVLAEITREKFHNAYIIIATNLQYNLLKTPFLSTLKSVDMVYLSIDGTGKIYEEIRPPSKWSILERSLKEIYENVSEETRKKKLWINTTVTEDNIDNLDDIYSLSRVYGLAGVRINLAQNWTESEMSSHEFDQNFINKIKKYKKDIKGVGGWEYKDCFWPFSGIIVDVNGDVRQCIINTSQKPFANINEPDFKEIYNNSIHYTHVRSKLKNNSTHYSCRNCDYKNLSPTLEMIFSDENEEVKNQPRSYVQLNDTLDEIIEKGGSLAQIEVRNNILEKGSSYDKETIKFQYDWYNYIGEKCYFPEVYSYTEDLTGAKYSMKYYKDSISLFEYMNINEKKGLELFDKALECLADVHKSTPMDIEIDQDKYIKNKIYKKLDEACEKSSTLRKVITSKEMVINGKLYTNFLDKVESVISKIREINFNPEPVCIHGDFNLENILITKDEMVKLIDPNKSNIVNNRCMDFSKMYQSLWYNYESMASCKSHTIDREKGIINYSIEVPGFINDLKDRFTDKVLNELSENEKKELFFHSAVNYIRLLPYKSLRDRKKEYIYIAKTIEIFNELDEVL